MPLPPMTRRGLVSMAAASLGISPVFPAQQRRRSPNFLFFLASQLRADWMSGTPGLSIQTPNLDAVAAGGLRFVRCLSAVPLSGPARACLASGREYPRCGVRTNSQDYPLDLPTFYQSLREAGYAVLGCGKLDLHKATRDWGIDGRRFLPEWGFTAGIDNAGKLDAVASGAIEPRDPYMAYLHRRGLATEHVADMRRRLQQNQYLYTEPAPLPEEAYADNWLAANGLDLLRSVTPGRPWFLQVSFTGPDSPLDVTRRMERLTRRRVVPQPIDSAQYTSERHTALRQNYTAIVENIDRWLGIYLEEIRRRGELAQTWIVYSSDHGEMLGDHERWGDSLPYQASVAVPLVIAGPGAARGTSEALVSHIDLAATLIDLAGAPRLPDADALTLRPVLEGKTKTHREVLRSACDRWRLAFDGRYKLIRGFDPGGARPRPRPAAIEGRPILFDRKLDPNETANIADEAPNQVERLSRMLQPGAGPRTTSMAR